MRQMMFFIKHHEDINQWNILTVLPISKPQTVFLWKVNFLLNQKYQQFIISKGILNNQNGYY